MRLSSVGVAAALVALYYSALTPVSAKEVSVGRWRILSGESSSGGNYCTMQLGNEVKGVGLQVMADGAIYLSVANPQWNFKMKQSVTTTYAVDKRPTWQGDAIAALPTILVIGLSPKSDPVGTLAGGKSFSARIGDDSVDFDLDGASDAQAALKTCLGSAASGTKAAVSAPATKTTVGDWEIEPVEGSPGECTAARDYVDKEDGNAENAIVVRAMPNVLMVALTYSKWNWSVGEKTKAAFVTPDAILNSDADWTADKTGKVLVTTLPLDKKDALAGAEELIVKFPDGDANFEAPKLGDAMKALATCASAK